MGAVRMRVQAADKNITIIHMTPVHQLTSCEAESGVFATNKSIKKFSFQRGHIMPILISLNEKSVTSFG